MIPIHHDLCPGDLIQDPLNLVRIRIQDICEVTQEQDQIILLNREGINLVDELLDLRIRPIWVCVVVIGIPQMPIGANPDLIHCITPLH